MTTANIITLIRIALIPIFMIALLSDFPFSVQIALVIFVVASVTDGVDGYIARKYNQVTTFGKFMDPLADKLLVTAAVLIFVQAGRMSPAAAMLIIAREFVVTSLRIVAISAGVVVPASTWGKIKTVVQIAGIGIMLLSWANDIPVAGTGAGNIIGWIMAAVALISGYDYIKNNWMLISQSM